MVYKRKGAPGRHAFLAGVVCVALGATTLRAGAVAAAGLPRSCDVVFIESTDAALRGIGDLVFRLQYTPGKLAFGGDPVACSVHPSQVGTTGAFTADDTAGTLRAELSRPNGLLLQPLVACTPRGSDDAETTTLSVELVEARDLKGDTLVPPPVVAVETFECSSSTTTLPTTTLPTTTLGAGTTTTTVIAATTSTVPPAPLCGDGDGSGSVTAADALLALREAVSAAICPADRCDTDANGSVTAADALRILRAAVGIPELLVCP